MRQAHPDLLKGILIAAGVLLIFFSVIILGMGIWEGFSSVRENVHLVTIPGIHEINFKSAGQYVGLYQHQGRGPVPIKFLKGMEYRLLSKDGYKEIPLSINKNADIIGKFGQEAVLLFNFVIEEAGEYSFSAFNLTEEQGFPELPVVIFGQGAQGLKQSIIIGALFFVLFLVLGIVVLIQAKKVGGTGKTG